MVDGGPATIHYPPPTIPGLIMTMREFDDREVEILILALRYWRVQRGQVARRTDPVFGPDEIDLLLSKLRGSLATEQQQPLVSSTHGDPH